MSIDSEPIPQTYDDAVATLARWHGEGGPADLRIFSFRDPNGQLVRLIEVSDDFAATGAVHPLVLGASDLYPFRSAAALLTQEEWEQVENGKIPLPSGWDLRSKEQVWP